MLFQIYVFIFTILTIIKHLIEKIFFTTFNIKKQII